MPFMIPVLWDIVLGHLFAYAPGNNWVISYNPHEQHLLRDSAQAFLNCRETCRGFDDYMLCYMRRFTMTPTRYATNTRGSIGSRYMEASCEIEFEQREFYVNAYGPKVEGSRYLSYRHLYREYRQYGREFLSAQRSLIRNKLVHDYVPRLSQHDPRIQYWLDQAADPTSRQDSPHFLCTGSKNTADTGHGISRTGPIQLPTRS